MATKQQSNLNWDLKKHGHWVSCKHGSYGAIPPIAHLSPSYNNATHDHGLPNVANYCYGREGNEINEHCDSSFSYNLEGW